jgi:hypothetical protein
MDNTVLENSFLTNAEISQLKLLEEEVDRYLRSGSRFPASSSIDKTLNLVLNRTLLPSKKVEVVWNKDAKKPFIMSITPDINELYTKSEKINAILNDYDNRANNKFTMVQEWADITHWYVEIDTRILTRSHRLCVDNGAEFVAILCHEVGHVMNENPMSLFYTYRRNALAFSTMERLMLSDSKIVRAIMLPMYCHTLQFMIVVDDRNNKKYCELAADAYVPDVYKGDLMMYINNHLLKDPDTNRLLMDRVTYEKEQEAGINLSRASISMLKNRRDVLNRQIQSQYNSPDSSTFHKKLMKFVGRHLTGYSPDEDKYITNLKTTMENAYNREYATMESKALKIVAEAARVTSRDIDILSVQAESIKTPEDKMYMIHKVYDYIDAIDNENAKKVKKGNIPKEFKDSRLDKLNAVRVKILSTDVNVAGDKYGVFVKYPTGYEG